MLLLGVASGLGAFGMAIMVPTMAELGRVFDTNLAAVQFVVTAYGLGLAVAQPVMGVLSDRFGRRPIILWGLTVFVAASWLCSFATSLEGLIFGRFFQAVGVSVGTVVSRALIRDVCDTEQTARGMSVISASLGIAPVIAPIAGGYLSANFGWETGFLLTAVTGAMTLVWVYFRLPETRAFGGNTTSDGNTRKKITTLLGSASFLGYTLAYGFISSAFFGFLVVGASIFEHYLGIDQETFGLIWGH
jgi:DHA1 family bicyclomycin/chloramphenicol resistance-like MFS transporter